MKSIRNILFDLDGTLIESSEGIINSVLYALDKLGIEEKKPSELKVFIGPPLIHSFAERYQLSTERAEAAVKYYREYFAVSGIYENRVYEGVEAMLSNLKGSGFRLFVATSKPTGYSERILQHHQLDHYFEAIVGASMDHTRLEKSQIIKYLTDHYDVSPDESIMVGDRRFDIEGAAENGLRSIFVTYGHGDLDEIKGLRPEHIVKDCREIPALLVK